MSFSTPKNIIVLLLVLFGGLNTDIYGAPEKAQTEEIRADSATVSYSNDEESDKIMRQHILFPHIKFEKPQVLIIILVVVIAFSLVSMLIILIFMLFNRGWMNRNQTRISELNEKYQSILLQFLEDETDNEEIKTEIQQIANSYINRVILINQIIDLSINLKGEKAVKLRDLFYELNLKKDALSKLKNRAWEVRVKGFRECAFMDITEGTPIIEKNLHSFNDIVRSEAQLALVWLRKEDPFAFLENLKRPFSIWEQNVVYENIIYHNLNIPDFERWLYVDNQSVVKFSLKMIRLFQQYYSWKKVSDFLKHGDEKIRAIAVKTLGALEIEDSQSALKNAFENETSENKILIIKALANIKAEANIKFFKDSIENNNDVWVQVEAARGIRSIEDKGNEILTELLEQEDYKNYSIIIKHVLDKRL